MALILSAVPAAQRVLSPFVNIDGADYLHPPPILKIII